MTKDLVVLTADVQQEKTIETLLNERRQALGIRAVQFDIYRHPRKDSGVYGEAAQFLRPYQHSHTYALVLLDRTWSGAPDQSTTIREHMSQRLQESGWSREHIMVIVVDPELEAWVWVDSPVIAETLRMEWTAIHALADELRVWTSGESKPTHPKELLEAVLYRQRRPRSAALFQEIARRVSLSRCIDPAFVSLRACLQHWFALVDG